MNGFRQQAKRAVRAGIAAAAAAAVAMSAVASRAQEGETFKQFLEQQRRDMKTFRAQQRATPVEPAKPVAPRTRTLEVPPPPVRPRVMVGADSRGASLSPVDRLNRARAAEAFYGLYGQRETELAALEKRTAELRARLFPTGRQVHDRALWSKADWQRAAELQRMLKEAQGRREALDGIRRRWDADFGAVFGDSSAFGSTLQVSCLDNSTFPGRIRYRTVDRIRYRIEGAIEDAQRELNPPPDPDTMTASGPDLVRRPEKPPAQAPEDEQADADTPAGTALPMKPPPAVEAAEPPPSAVVAPSLAGTRWNGALRLVQEMILGEDDEEAWYGLNPAPRASLKLAITGGNGILGDGRFDGGLAALRLGAAGETLGLKLSGEYDARTGRFTMTAAGRLLLPAQGANLAGVPMAPAVTVVLSLKGAAYSDSDIGGTLSGRLRAELAPGRPVTDDDIQSWAELQAPPEWKERKDEDGKPYRVDIAAEARKVLVNEARKQRERYKTAEITDTAVVYGEWSAWRPPSNLFVPTPATPRSPPDKTRNEQ